ncbi:hypothetical protein [Azospirillum argentinense]
MKTREDYENEEREEFMRLVLPVARHEVGHWLMAERQGFIPQDIEITIIDYQGSHSAGAVVNLACSLTSIAGVQDYLRRRIQILYSGAIAEALDDCNQVNNDRAIYLWKFGNAENDRKAADDLLQLLRSVTYELPTSDAEMQQQLDTIVSELWSSAIEFTQQEHAAIGALANAIAKRVTSLGKCYVYSAEEIRQQLEAADWPKRPRKS